MSEGQRAYFQDLIMSDAAVTNEFIQYWKQYSNITTWQFWVTAIAIIVFLVVLFFKIDRENIFLVGFFGFATHVIFTYADIMGMRLGYWGYPYQLIPFFPSFTLDAALIPITLMLVFQWTYRNNKNYYIFAFLAALFFGFVFKPFLTSVNLFVKYEPINYFMIFLIYIVLFIIPYWLSKGFLWMQKHAETEVNELPKRRDTNRETTPHPDGFKEGVMSDPTGVQYGVEVGHEKIVNRADIAKMTSEKSDREKKQ